MPGVRFTHDFTTVATFSRLRSRPLSTLFGAGAFPFKFQIQGLFIALYIDYVLGAFTVSGVTRGKGHLFASGAHRAIRAGRPPAAANGRGW